MRLVNLEEVRDNLKQVLDPEIGVNVVDLGLIYDVSEPKDGQVLIKMTLTTPDCPMHEDFLDAVEGAAGHAKDVEYVKIDLVFDPPWTPHMMSPKIREAMGIQ